MTADVPQVDAASLQEALRVGIALHRSGDLDRAREVYDGILQVAPEQPEVLHFSGMLGFQAGHRDEGIGRVRRAIDLAPGNPGMWSNLGNMLKMTDDADGAEAAYRKAIELSPEWVDAHCNLGVLLRGSGRRESAIEAFRDALALDPDHVATLHNLGNLYSSLRQWPQAIDCFGHVIELDADTRTRSLSAEGLIRALASSGRRDEIRDVLERWHGWDPDNPIAAHLLAAHTASDVPSRASDAYVRSVFDTFADSFDSVLEGLEYRAPALVARKVEERVVPLGAPLAILDAGCGTGLAGPSLAPHARRLVGVDISAGMLEKAARRQVYDELVEAEMTAHLQSTPARHDLIVAVDALVYFGALDALAAALHRSLTPSGWVVLTVEQWAGAGEFRLDISGRYQHTSRYVGHALAAAGFEEVELEEVLLRLEGGQPVSGLLVSARKPAAPE